MKVAFPVAAPMDIFVAAPNAFIVVAFVLNTAKVASLVTTLVVNVGVVPNTKEPDPVSSDNADDIAEDVVEAETVPDDIVSMPVELLKF